MLLSHKHSVAKQGFCQTHQALAGTRANKSSHRKASEHVRHVNRRLTSPKRPASERSSGWRAAKASSPYHSGAFKMESI